MTLEQYLSNSELSNAGFGELIGVTRMAVLRYRDGSRMPEPEIAAKIVKATDGAVTIEDMHRAHMAWRRAQPATAPQDAA